MAALPRLDLERLLQERKLHGTLTSSLPAEDRQQDERVVAPSGADALDARLGGGWPRGQVSEVVGQQSAGVSWVACQSMAAATRRGELAALVDPLDRFDPQTAATAGFVWPSLLWVRGVALAPPAGSLAGTGRHRAGAAVWTGAIERALKALALILQAEGFGVVVLDFQGIPPSLGGQLPFTTWRRIQRLVEGRDTACLLLHGESLGRSAGGVTLTLTPGDEGERRGVWSGCSRARRLAGLAARARVVRAQWQAAALDEFAWTSA